MILVKMSHIMKNRFGPDGITFPCKMNTNTVILKFMKVIHQMV